MNHGNPHRLANVTHDWRRTATAVAGLVFSIILVFMQLGFYTSTHASATMVYDLLRFDAMVLSPAYVHLMNADTVPQTRLRQAAGVPGVAAVVPIYVGPATWHPAPHGNEARVADGGPQSGRPAV